MSSEIPKTNFRMIEREYSDLITEIRNVPLDEGEHRCEIQKKIILFRNMSRLKCREIIKNEFISIFQYDLYDSDGNIVMKFHSEPHMDQRYQTETEPFHLHVRVSSEDLAASKRLPLPEEYRELHKIIHFIQIAQYTIYLYMEQKNL